MINLLLPLLLFPSVPDMYQDEVARTDVSITVSLVPRTGLYRSGTQAMTGQIPRTLYLLSLPVWHSFEDEEERSTEIPLSANQPNEPLLPLLLHQYQVYFDRLLAGRDVEKVIEAPARVERLACQISAAALSQSAFASWHQEATMNDMDDFFCSQITALATLFSDGVVSPDEHESVDMSEDDSASSFFSVLNLTIPTNSAPPPNWQPLLSQHKVSTVDSVPDGAFIFPLAHEIVVTSPYGMRYHPIVHQFIRHEGVDLRAPVNSEVMAIADGEVTEAGYGPVTGFYITVNHADGWSSRYLHLNTLSVHKGDKVFRGNVIALSGATGRTNGPHLHLEIGHRQQLSNPMDVLSASTFTPNYRRPQHATPLSEEKGIVPESIDMTPTITLISGEGKDTQIGIRIGKKTAFYLPSESVETADGIWRIVKRHGKFKLVKLEPVSEQE